MTRSLVNAPSPKRSAEPCLVNEDSAKRGTFVVRGNLKAALRAHKGRCKLRVVGKGSRTLQALAEASLGGVSEASGRSALGYGAYLTAHTSARMVSMRMPSIRDNQKGGGKRGKVTRFSNASRLRMFKVIHRVRRMAALPVFVTLTFPDLFPDIVQARRALDTLFKRWKRRWPDVSALWRVEAKPRQSGSMRGQVAPHFHLLVWGAGFVGHKAREDWFEVCGNSEYAHWKHGYDDGGKEMSSWQEAAAYLAAYCAKKGNVECEGRQWGIHNRAALPTDNAPLVVRMTLREAWAMRRALRRSVEGKIGRRCKHAATIFTKSPLCFVRLLAHLRAIGVPGRTEQPGTVQHWQSVFQRHENKQLMKGQT